MRSGKKHQEAEEAVELSLSPLIDCVFLLLIFFLVSTMMKQESKDIDIKLPKSTSALEVRPDDTVVVIGVDSKGKYYYEGVETSLNSLRLHLRNISLENPDQNFRLDCDKSTEFLQVVQVLDLLSFHGMKNVGVRTYDGKYNM